MINTAFKKYAAYKDSGVEWLGDVPAHWEITFLVKTLSSLADYRGRTPQKVGVDENGIFLVTARNIKKGRIDYSLSEEFADIDDVQSLLNRGRPAIGDVLFTTEAPLGEVANVDRIDIALAQRIIKFRGKAGILDNYFMKYWLMSSVFQYSLQRNATGSTALGIKGSKVRLLNVVIPPLDEQKGIAAYLDEKTAVIDHKIDLLIQKAAQYTHLKQALINETVTRGLDKTAPLKDGGIAWLGEIPAHWEVKRVNDIAIRQTKKNVGLVEKNLLSLSYGKIIRRDFYTSYGLLPASFETYQIVDRGNIILRLTDLQNDWTSLRAGLVVERGIITSAYLCLRLSRSIYAPFAYYLLHVYDILKVFYRLGGGLRQSMKWEDIKILPFVLPPFSEQKAIADYLNTKTTHINRIVETIKRQIETLRELRKTLINDVVTGKIKVIA